MALTHCAGIKDLDLIANIDDPGLVPSEKDSSDSEEEHLPRKKLKRKRGDFKASFKFIDSFQLPKFKDIKKTAIVTKQSSLDEKIAKARKAKQKQKDVDKDFDDDMKEEEDDSEDEFQQDTVKTRDRKKKKRGAEEDEELEEKVQFSESVDSYDNKIMFHDMNLSRPLLKGLSAMNLSKPTPIQAACIPVALLGRDICACAVTGSGKTVAFMLPILERLLYRPKASACTRVLILLPTRELAVQVHTVARQLGQHANMEFCLVAGGLDIKSQEAALRLSPDMVIATPGRLIDHLHNSLSFTLHNIEILVLDEADRMLDEYFAEQMKEIIRMCSRQRQTMLFSATLSESVQDLVAVSLKDPIRVFVNESTDVALGLRQEFVRIRANREGDREAIVAALVSRNFQDKCIIFIQTKVQVHRMHILLGLLGLNIGELHGNLPQPQRLEILKKFKEGLVDILLATDLAARGLDIEGIKTVINFTMPSTLQHYIHRVGRTARAGKSGRSVTLVGERERKVLKEVMKQAKTPLKTRIISAEVISKFRQRITSLEEDITQIQLQEKEESCLQSMENQMHKAQNLLASVRGGPGEGNHPEPAGKRVWFQSHRERKMEKESLHLMERSKSKGAKKTRKKLTAEDRVHFEMSKAELLGIRAFKQSERAKPLKAFMEFSHNESTSNQKNKKKTQNSAKYGFEDDLADVGISSVKKHRTGLSYKECQEASKGSKKVKPFGRKRKR